MELITGIFLALAWILILPGLRLAITFFHEMGHAIPALVFTDDKVEVFVGSYGDREKALKVSLGRLVFYFNFQVLDWQIGMCIPHGKSSGLGQWIILLGGPIASTLVSGTILYLMIKYSYTDGVLAIAIAFFLMALFDLVVNLYPRETSFVDEDGGQMMSDGTQLMALWRRRSLPSEYLDMFNEYKEGNTSQVIDRIETKKMNNPIDKEYYYLLIDCYQKEKNYEKVITTYEQMVDYFPLSIFDYKEIGIAYFYLKNYTESLRCLNKYLHLHFKDYEANCKRGEVRMELGNYEEAYRDFEAAILYSTNNNAAKPLSHRAFIKMKFNDYHGAWEDLQVVLDLSKDAIDPQLYFYIASYHEYNGDYKEALKNYELAKTNGFSHHGLEYKIYAANEYVEGRSL